MTGRKTLDKVCQTQGFSGYKSYLKSESFANVKKLICKKFPQCEYCGAKSKTAIFTDPNPSNLFGLTTEGIVASCLACEHKIKTTKDGRRRQVRHQIAMADGMQQRPKSRPENHRITPDAALELLKKHGFGSFNNYMASDLFAAKSNDCMKHHHGRCGCCKGKATGIHFRWFTAANLLSDVNHGWMPICNTCRGQLQSMGKLSKSSMGRTEKRLQKLIGQRITEKARLKLEKQQKQLAAMQETNGSCCICENGANTAREFAGRTLPLCWTCSGQADGDKDFQSHLVWFAKTYGKRLSHFKQPQPADKPTPKPPVQTFITKDHSQLPNSPLAMRVKITKPGNGAEQAPF